MKNKPDECCNAFTDFTGKKQMKKEIETMIVRGAICAMWGFFLGCFIAGLIVRANKPAEDVQEPVRAVEESADADQASIAGVKWMFSRWAVD